MLANREVLPGECPFFAASMISVSCGRNSRSKYRGKWGGLLIEVGGANGRAHRLKPHGPREDTQNVQDRPAVHCLSMSAWRDLLPVVSQPGDCCCEFRRAH